MTRRPARRRLAALMIVGLTAGPLAVGVGAASAQDPEPVDLDGDGQRDDWNGDGLIDTVEGMPCEAEDKDDADQTGTPDGIPDANTTSIPGCDGTGGILPDQLTEPQIATILWDVFNDLPDVDETAPPDEEPDGFPNIPRRIDPATGEDLGPDWSALDRLIGEPGIRDLLQDPDNFINEDGLEEEDYNNISFVDPLTGDTVFIGTDEGVQKAMTQVARAGGDLGNLGGSGAELRGPCMGQAWSYDSDGRPLDVAWDWDIDGPPIGFRPSDEIGAGELAVEPRFTSENPFKVDMSGAVIYTGVAGGLADGTGPLEHDWFIRMEFLGFTGANLDAGGDPNRSGENRNLGAVNLDEDIPALLKISGLMAINGQMEAPESGTGAVGADGNAVGNGVRFFCIASGFVDFDGDIPLTAPGVALVFMSTVGMIFNARPARTFGGV